MGNASAHARSIPISQQSGDLRERLQEDLPKFIYIERLSNGKFLKSYRCKVDGVGVVLKVMITSTCLYRLSYFQYDRSCGDLGSIET